MDSTTPTTSGPPQIVGTNISDTWVATQTGGVAEPAGVAGLCNVKVLLTDLSMPHGSCSPAGLTALPEMSTETLASSGMLLVSDRSACLAGNSTCRSCPTLHPERLSDGWVLASISQVSL